MASITSNELSCAHVLCYTLSCIALQHNFLFSSEVASVHASTGTDPFGTTGAIMHGYVPVKTGTRFSANARRPSSRSSVGSTWTMAKNFSKKWTYQICSMAYFPAVFCSCEGHGLI